MDQFYACSFSKNNEELYVEKQSENNTSSQEQARIHVICDACIADSSLSVMSSIANRTEKNIRAFLANIPRSTLTADDLQQAMDFAHADLAQLQQARDKSLAVSAMILVEQGGSKRQILAAAIGDQRLYQTTPDTTGLLFRDAKNATPKDNSSDERLKALSNALGFSSKPTMQFATFQPHPHEAWTVLSHAVASSLSDAEIRFMGLDPLQNSTGVGSTLKRLDDSKQLLRAYTLGLGALACGEADAKGLYKLYTTPRRAAGSRFVHWAAAGVAALAVLTGATSEVTAADCQCPHSTMDCVDWSIAAAAIDTVRPEHLDAAGAEAIAMLAEDLLCSDATASHNHLRHRLRTAISEGDKPQFQQLSRQLIEENEGLALALVDSNESGGQGVAEKIAALRAKAARLRSEQETAVAIASELERLQAEIAHRDSLIASLREEQTSLQNALSVAPAVEDLEAAVRGAEALQENLTALNSLLSEKDALIEDLEGTRGKLIQELEGTESKARSLQSRIDTLEAARAALVVQTTEQTESIAQLQEKYEQEVASLQSKHAEEMNLLETQQGDTVTSLTTHFSDEITSLRSEQANRLSSLKEGYCKEINSITKQHDETLAGLRSQLAETTEHLQLTQATLSDKEQALEQLTQGRKELVESLASANEKLSLLEKSLVAVNKLDERVRERTALIDQVQVDHENLREVLRSMQEQKTPARIAELSERLDQLDGLQATVQSLSDEQSKAPARISALSDRLEELEALRQTVQSLADEQGKTPAQISALAERFSELEALQGSVLTLTEEQNKTPAQIAALAERFGELEALQRSVQTLTEEQNKTPAQIAALTERFGELEALQGSVQTLTEEQNKTPAQIAALAERFSELEALQGSVQTLTEEQNKTPAQIAALAERFSELEALQATVKALSNEQEKDPVRMSALAARLAELESLQDVVQALSEEQEKDPVRISALGKRLEELETLQATVNTLAEEQETAHHYQRESIDRLSEKMLQKTGEIAALKAHNKELREDLDTAMIEQDALAHASREVRQLIESNFQNNEKEFAQTHENSRDIAMVIERQGQMEKSLAQLDLLSERTDSLAAALEEARQDAEQQSKAASVDEKRMADLESNFDKVSGLSEQTQALALALDHALGKIGMLEQQDRRSSAEEATKLEAVEEAIGHLENKFGRIKDLSNQSETLSVTMATTLEKITSLQCQNNELRSLMKENYSGDKEVFEKAAMNTGTIASLSARQDALETSLTQVADLSRANDHLNDELRSALDKIAKLEERLSTQEIRSTEFAGRETVTACIAQQEQLAAAMQAVEKENFDAGVRFETMERSLSKMATTTDKLGHQQRDMADKWARISENQTIKGLVDDQQMLTAEVQAARQQVEVVNKDMERLDNFAMKLAEHQQQLAGLSHGKEALENSVSAVENRFTKLEENVQSLSFLEGDMNDIVSRLDDLQSYLSTVEELRVALSERDRSIREITKEQRALGAKLEASAGRVAQLEEQVEQGRALKRAVHANRESIASLETEVRSIDEIDSRLQTREQMLTDITRSHGTIESILRATQTKVALLQKEVERSRDLRDIVKSDESLIKSIHKAQDSLIVEVTTTKRKLNTIERRMDVIGDLEDKLREKDAMVANLNFTQKSLENKLEASQGKISYLEKQLTTIDKLDRQVTTIQQKLSTTQ